MTKIEEFIEVVKQGKYVQAHEILEDDWRFYRKKGLKPEEKAIQGLINGATALALFFIKKRPTSYEKVWKVFEKYEHYLNIANLENIEKYIEAKELLLKINSTIKK
ncbi:DUF309 domain-containing protein [Halarcobacter sp.]|uniref:DUF309 domain-containing protein n=1 Tax=Halarcobacter sp. TaxID=2321133 RepID=UPI0029F4FB5B|nr:DUF309 domain-containing protein [Halarcobacter sp.]